MQTRLYKYSREDQTVELVYADWTYKYTWKYDCEININIHVNGEDQT